MVLLALSTALLAATGSSDSGGKEAGESASAWHSGGFLFWILIVLGAVAVLVVGLLLTLRRDEE